jgi:hypothetical protein
LMVGRPSPQSPSISRLTSPPDRILSKCRRSRHQIPTPLATAPRAEFFLTNVVCASRDSYGARGLLTNFVLLFPEMKQLLADWLRKAKSDPTACPGLALDSSTQD